MCQALPSTLYKQYFILLSQHFYKVGTNITTINFYWLFPRHIIIYVHNKFYHTHFTYDKTESEPQ